MCRRGRLGWPVILGFALPLFSILRHVCLNLSPCVSFDAGSRAILRGTVVLAFLCFPLGHSQLSIKRLLSPYALPPPPPLLLCGDRELWGEIKGHYRLLLSRLCCFMFLPFSASSSCFSRVQEAVEERDEAESSVQKRGESVRQRALHLAAELREERALTAKLKAASEKGDPKYRHSDKQNTATRNIYLFSFPPTVAAIEVCSSNVRRVTAHRTHTYLRLPWRRCLW